MKFWSSEHTFMHHWDRVTQAAWRKYPNEVTTTVQTLDVLDRYVDEEGRLHSKRLIGSEGLMPNWVCRMFGATEMAYVYEHTTTDLKNKTMVSRTKNLTLASWVEVEETVTYTEHAEDKNKTLFNQDTSVKVFGVSFHDYCESLIKNTMVRNASKGRQAMESVINKINREVQDLATNFEQATSRLNTELEQAALMLNSELEQAKQGFEQAKQGLEQATRLPQAMCEGKSEASQQSL